VPAGCGPSQHSASAASHSPPPPTGPGSPAKDTVEGCGQYSPRARAGVYLLSRACYYPPWHLPMPLTAHQRGPGQPTRCRWPRAVRLSGWLSPNSAAAARIGGQACCRLQGGLLTVLREELPGCRACCACSTASTASKTGDTVHEINPFFWITSAGLARA
jgi:hypothetical protein